MLTLKDYARETIKTAGAEIRFADSLIGKGAKQLSGVTSSAVDKLRALLKSAPGPEAQRKAVIKFWDSAAGKALKATGAAAAGAAKLTSKIFTRKGPSGKRELDIIKGLMITAPAAGMYHGMKRGEMKSREYRLYGQKRSPLVYADPRRRLR